MSEVKQAISDVNFMLQVIDGQNEAVPEKSEIAITALMAAASLTLIVLERWFFPGITSATLFETSDESVKNGLMLQLIFVLALLAAGVYGLVWLRANSLQSTLDRTLGRSFEYLKLEKFIPDLILKAFLLRLILGAAPEAMSALLLAFTADYALQGRFFRLPRLLRIGLGFILYVIAVSMWIQHSSLLLIPLVAFCFLSLASLVSIVILRKRHGRN